MSEVLVFLDDIIVFFKTLEEQDLANEIVKSSEIVQVEIVSRKKLHLFKSVKYLGHVDADGVHKDPEKISGPCPSTRQAKMVSRLCFVVSSFCQR